MSSNTRKLLKSEGGGEYYQPPAEEIVIAEEDPTHPHHHEHMARMRPDDPDNIALCESLREFGWLPSKTIPVYRDGDHYTVSDGRRSLTMTRIVNAERKAAKDRREPIRPRVVLDTDPALTTTIANEMRKGDPPMVRARRFVELRGTLGTNKAAAALGLSVRDAQALAEILGTPNAELHAAVNAAVIPIDTAARAAKKGGATVRAVIAKAKSPSGKIDAKVAEAASKEGPRRAKTCPARMVVGVSISFLKTTTKAPQYTGEEVAALLRWIAGDTTSLEKEAKFERVWRIVESGEAEMQAVDK